MRRMVRTRKGETPEKGIARIRRARAATVRRLFPKKVYGPEVLEERLERAAKRLGKALPGKGRASLNVVVRHLLQGKMRMELQFDGRSVGGANFQMVREGDRLDAVISGFQGIKQGKRFTKEFEEVVGRPWNVVLVQSVVDAAYHAGFDRILLKDVTKTNAYALPAVNEKYLEEEPPTMNRAELLRAFDKHPRYKKLKPREKVFRSPDALREYWLKPALPKDLREEISREVFRGRMKQLYTWTKKDCDFTKREGDYWVREFP